MAILHTKIGIKVDKVGLVMAVGEYVVEKDIGRYAVPSVGGASCKETKLEPIAGGEHGEAVTMGMTSRFRGIPHLPHHVVCVSFVFV